MTIGIGTRLLADKKLRLLAAAASVAVAVIVMFVESGFLIGILDSQALLATLVRGDLIVMNIARTNLHRWDKIDAIRLDQIAALPGVDHVAPIYEDHVGLRSPDDKRVRRIIVYAVPPDDIPLDIGNDPAAIAQRLKISQGFLFDRLSRPIFGNISPGKDIKIDRLPQLVTGYVDIGPDIVNDGAIVMSVGNWLARSPQSQPIMGVIYLKPGVAPDAERKIILSRLPKDIAVMTPEQARWRENWFTLTVAPVGLLFAVGMLAGFVIGTINCYQVLYNEVNDRLPQYATLKAMGFSDGFLRRVIFEQAALLSLLGFGVGIVGAAVIDYVIAWEATLPVRITPASGSVVFLVTIVMCMGAGLAAIRRVAVADPAALY